MKHWMLAVSLLIAAALLAGCVSQERKGQRLFAGCLDKVNDEACSGPIKMDREKRGLCE